MRTTNLIFVVLLSAASCKTQPQEPSKLIPREAIFSDRTNQDLTLSGSGKYILFKNTSGENTTYQIKDSQTGVCRNISELGSFSKPYFKGDSILFFTDYPSSLLYIYDPKIERLDSLQLDVTYEKAGFYGEMSKKPKILAFLKQGEGYNFQKIDLRNGTVEYVEQVKHRSYLFNDSLDLVAASNLNERGGISFHKKSGEEWVEFLSHDWDEGLLMGKSLNSLVSYDSDAELIYFTSHFDEDKVGLYEIALEQSDPKPIVYDKDFDLTDRGAFIGPQGELKAIKTLNADFEWKILNSSITGDFTFLKNEIQGNFEVIGASANDAIWLVKSMTGAPVEYLIYSRNQDSLRTILWEKPDLTSHELVERTTYSYPTRDGYNFPVQAYQSGLEIAKGNLPPAVVYVHGGPWVANFWDSWTTNRHLQLLADRGYVVLVPDFRGSLGYGKQVVTASAKEWGGNMHNDILDCLGWARGQNLIDEKRVGIFGWSYGGYEAMYALADPDSTQFACGIAQFGPSDLVSFLQSDLGKQGLWKMGVGNVETEEDFLRSISPAHLVKNYSSPILISHGQKDQLVPIEQSDMFVEKLQENHKKVSYISFSNEGHDYVDSKNHQSFWALAEAFLHQHLGGAAQPISSELENENILSLDTGKTMKP